VSSVGNGYSQNDDLSGHLENPPNEPILFGIDEEVDIDID
jgi:hypothetical protein